MLGTVFEGRRLLVHLGKGTGVFLPMPFKHLAKVRWEMLFGNAGRDPNQDSAQGPVYEMKNI